MRFPTTVLSDLNSKDDIDENTYVFSKFYGEDTTKWKCANDECNSPTEITGQDLKVLDNEDMVSWEKFGPLGIVVFPLCHHCGNSLAQEYRVLIEDNAIDITNAGLTGANDDFGPVQMIH